MTRAHIILSSLVAIVLGMAVCGTAPSQTAVPMLVNYQGEVRSPSTGEPVPDGSYNMVLRIYDVESGGTALWQGVHSDINGNPVQVTNGIFSVILGSGSGNIMDASVFNGAERWLEIRVGMETLSPRQRITSVAYSLVSENSRLLAGREASQFANSTHAHSGSEITSGTVLEARIDPSIARDTEQTTAIAAHAAIPDAHHAKTTSLPWGSITSVPAGFADGVDDNSGGDITGVTAGAGLTGGGDSDGVTLSAAFEGNGLAKTVAHSDHNHDATYWTLTGNTGTSGTNFLGTTDNQPLELRVNNGRALRLEPNATCPNLIGGLSRNTGTSGAYGATIGGGGGEAGGTDKNLVTDIYGTIGGGEANQAGDNAGTTGDAECATVGGGKNNYAMDYCATVAGGILNKAHMYCAVSGGYDNIADGLYSTIGGGEGNRTDANYATIAGGGTTVHINPDYGNRVTDDFGTVGGGGNNQAGDNAGTAANAAYSTVSGGSGNTASGKYAAIPGGLDNVAQGDYSFAAGRRAKANYDGCFVWGDSTDDDIATSGPNRFAVRASGGVWFYSKSDKTTGVRLPADDSAWTTVSDRALKENIRQVDRQEILSKLIQIPISRWSYKGQTPDIEHIGPMAQDFYAAFGLGDDERYISTIDPDGVALAAIQGLHEMLREKDKKISTLEARVEALETLVEKLVESQAGGEK